jgi:hypothetical protein
LTRPCKDFNPAAIWFFGRRTIHYLAALAHAPAFIAPLPEQVVAPRLTALLQMLREKVAAAVAIAAAATRG